MNPKGRPGDQGVGDLWEDPRNGDREAAAFQIRIHMWLECGRRFIHTQDTD